MSAYETHILWLCALRVNNCEFSVYTVWIFMKCTPFARPKRLITPIRLVISCFTDIWWFHPCCTFSTFYDIICVAHFYILKVVKHEMTSRIGVIILHQIVNITWFPLFSRWNSRTIARQDMNIKVTAFTESKKFYYICVFVCLCSKVSPSQWHVLIYDGWLWHSLVIHILNCVRF